LVQGVLQGRCRQRQRSAVRDAGQLGEGQAQAAHAVAGMLRCAVPTAAHRGALMPDFVDERALLREYEQQQKQQ
jgi:hypothetical protein